MTNIPPVTDKTLIQLIDDSGLKRSKIADELEVHRSRLWQLLDDPKKIDTERINKLSEILGIDHQIVYQAIQNQISKGATL